MSSTRSEPSRSSEASTSAAMVSWRVDLRAYSAAFHSVMHVAPAAGYWLVRRHHLSDKPTMADVLGHLRTQRVARRSPISSSSNRASSDERSGWFRRPFIAAYEDN